MNSLDTGLSKHRHPLTSGRTAVFDVHLEALFFHAGCESIPGFRSQAGQSYSSSGICPRREYCTDPPDTRDGPQGSAGNQVAPSNGYAVSRWSHSAGNTFATDLDAPSPHGKVHNLIFPLTNAFGSPFGIVFEVLLNSQDGIRIGRYLRFTVGVTVPLLSEWLVT